MFRLVCFLFLSQHTTCRRLTGSHWVRVALHAEVNDTDDGEVYRCWERGLVCFTGQNTELKDRIILQSTDLGGTSGPERGTSTGGGTWWSTYMRVESGTRAPQPCEDMFQVYVIYRRRRSTYLGLLDREAGRLVGYEQTTPSKLSGVHGILTHYAYDAARACLYQADDVGLSILKLKPLNSLTFKLLLRWNKRSRTRFLFWEGNLKWVLYVRTTGGVSYFGYCKDNKNVILRLFERRMLKYGVDIQRRLFYYIYSEGKYLFFYSYTSKTSDDAKIPLSFLQHTSSVTLSLATSSVMYCDYREQYIFNFNLMTNKTTRLFPSMFADACPSVYTIGTRVFTLFEQNILEYDNKGRQLTIIQGVKHMFNIKFLRGEVAFPANRCKGP